MMAEILLNKDNFQKEVLDEKGYMLVDFFASWCGPCKMLSPVIHEIAEEYAGVVKVGKVDVDVEMSLANEYGIVSIPTLILFKGGVPVKRSMGFASKADIVKMWSEGV